MTAATSSSKPIRPFSFFPTILFCLITGSTLIAIPAYAYLYGFSRVAWATFGILYLITGLGITVGYHRLIAHRSFACPSWVKAAFLVAGGWALENSALKWASDHRRHHALCDREEDPYNAQWGFWWSHCGWIFYTDPHADQKFAARLRQDPLVLWQHRYYVPIVLSGLALPLIIGFLEGGWNGAFSCFLLAGVGRTFFVLNSTFFVNSICHLWGKQPHGRSDSSRDSWWVSLLTFGEGYHNYHHAYQTDYRNGPCWYNIDPSKWLIFSLSLLGLATSLRRGSNEQA